MRDMVIKNSTVVILADFMIRLVIGGHDCSCATVLSGEQDLWASHLCSTYSDTKYKRSSSDFQFKQTVLTIVWYIVYVIFELIVQSYYKREKKKEDTGSE